MYQGRNLQFENTIIERYVKCGKNIYFCFIEYEKAFDIVKHEKIIECMENLDIDGKDLNMIRNMYWNHKAHETGCHRKFTSK